MELRSLPDGSLVVVDSFRFLRTAALACIALAVATLGWAWSEGTAAGEIGWAALGIAVLCLPGLVVDDRRFEFNASHRMLRWERRNFFRARRGELPFSDIRDVSVASQAELDDERVGGRTVKYQAVLLTASGPMPLTSRHGVDSREFEALAARARAAIGLAPQSPDSTEQRRHP